MFRKTDHAASEGFYMIQGWFTEVWVQILGIILMIMAKKKKKNVFKRNQSWPGPASLWTQSSNLGLLWCPNPATPICDICQETHGAPWNISLHLLGKCIYIYFLMSPSRIPSRRISSVFYQTTFLQPWIMAHEVWILLCELMSVPVCLIKYKVFMHFWNEIMLIWTLLICSE